ncbi:MAG: tRNA adenosine(34) deaminase TadA [Bryobacteraceae bacterium]
MDFDRADERFMRQALKLAQGSEQAGEVPVGAVVVMNGEVIGRGSNSPITDVDPTAHAEIKALRDAARYMGNYRIPNSTIYCTLEPCAMCAGAIVLARVERLIFAARDIRFGAVRSKFTLADSPLLNHRVQVQEGLLAAESSELLTKFFQQTRIRD